MDILNELNNSDYQPKHTRSGDPVISDGTLKINGHCPISGHTTTFSLTWDNGGFKDYTGKCPQCQRFVSSRMLFGK